jgi:lipopolysaccharide export system permease protein
MRTLSRMLVRSFLPVFLASLFLFVMILQLVDLFSNLVKFLNYETTPLQILQVMALFTPKCVSYSLPIALLFSVAYVLGSMYTNNELIAIFGSGISLYRLVLPFIAIGMILSVGDFFFENNMVIQTLKAKNDLTRVLLRQKVSLSNSDITIISNGNEVIYHVDYYNDQSRTLSGVEIVERNSDGKFISRVNASTAKWQNGKWVFSDCERYYWTPDGSSLTNGYYSMYTQDNLNEPPDTFRRSAAKVEEMKASDAKKHIENLERTGLPFASELTEYYQRFAYAATPLIIVIISVSFGGFFKKNILLMSLLASLVTAVIYYVAQMMTVLFAKLGYMSPFAGAWLPSLIFAVIAIISIRFIRT